MGIIGVKVCTRYFGEKDFRVVEDPNLCDACVRKEAEEVKRCKEGLANDLKGWEV